MTLNVLPGADYRSDVFFSVHRFPFFLLNFKLLVVTFYFLKKSCLKDKPHPANVKMPLRCQIIRGWGGGWRWEGAGWSEINGENGLKFS